MRFYNPMNSCPDLKYILKLGFRVAGPSGRAV